MGFSQIGVPYNRDDRRFGTSKFNLASMTQLAIDAVTSHSVVPLRLATYCGLAITGIAILAMSGYADETGREGVDRYADAWVEQHTVICQATRVTGEQSEALLDVRMTCMDRRLGELGALVKVLSSPEEETVSRAVTAVAELRRPEPCATAQPGVENTLPEEPGRRTRFLQLQAQLDDVSALQAAGRYAEARDLAADTAEASARQGFRRLVANAKIWEGSALRQMDQAKEAIPRLREGIMLASAVADVRSELTGWMELMWVSGVILEEADQATGWRFAAEAALERAGSPKDLDSRFQRHLGTMLLRQNRFEEATRVGEDALRIALEVGGQGSLQHAQALNTLGMIAAKQADWSVAQRRLSEAHQLEEQLYGPEHPDVATSSINLANVLMQYAKTTAKTDPSGSEALMDEAEQRYEAAVAIRERAYGSTSAALARALVNLGVLQRRRGNNAKARRSYERALAILRELSGVEGDLTSTLNNLAVIEREELAYEEAETMHREALAIQLDKYGDQHLSVGRTRQLLCKTLAQSAQHAAAVKECARALEVLEAGFKGRPNPAIRSVHEITAEALTALGRNSEAARHRAKAEELARRLEANVKGK